MNKIYRFNQCAAVGLQHKFRKSTAIYRRVNTCNHAYVPSALTLRSLHFATAYTDPFRTSLRTDRTCFLNSINMLFIAMAAQICFRDRN